jgi:hypothetical protein
MNLALMSPSAFGPLQLFANVCNSTVPAPCWRGLWFSTPRTATPTAGLQHERRRRAALGPRADATTADFEFLLQAASRSRNRASPGLRNAVEHLK